MHHCQYEDTMFELPQLFVMRAEPPFKKFRLSVCSMQCHPQTSYEGLNLFLFNFFEGGFFVFVFQCFNLLITLFGSYVTYTYLCRINILRQWNNYKFNN